MVQTSLRAACFVLTTAVHSHDVLRLSIHYQHMTETKTSIVQLRIRPSLKEAAEKAASADQRSLTSLVEKVLTDYLKKNGYLPK
jgi:predicted HicB family RNase H-like nuclease